jgi:hypothetical protein
MSRVYSLAAEVRKPGSPVSKFMRDHFPHLAETQAEFKAQVAHLPTVRPGVCRHRLGKQIDAPGEHDTHRGEDAYREYEPGRRGWKIGCT